MSKYITFTKEIVKYPQIESVSFLQGSLIAALSLNKELKVAEWIAFISKEINKSPNISEDLLSTLHSLFLHTINSIDADNFSFQLLLPTEEDLSRQTITDLNNAESIAPMRFAALIDFCDGFIFSLGFFSMQYAKNLDDNIANLLEILNTIRAFDLNLSESLDDDSVADFYEIEETLRLGVMDLLI